MVRIPALYLHSENMKQEENMKTTLLMNRTILSAAMAVMLVCVSCTNGLREEDFEPQHSTREILSVSLSAEGFAPMGKTRATTGTDFVTKFANGDKIGLIAVRKDGTVDERFDNIMMNYTYSSSPVTFPQDFQAYYDNELTYIAYYPYSENASGLASIEAIREMFQPALDQSSQENYTASDVMAAEGVWDGNAKKLVFSLKHLHSLLLISDSRHERFVYHGIEGHNTYGVSKVALTIGDKVYKPWHSKSWYQVIVPASDIDVEMRSIIESSTIDGIVEYALRAEMAFGSGTYNEWHIQDTDFGEIEEVSLEDVSPTDYFCSDMETGQWYLMPSNLTPTDAHKVIGVVFYTGHHPDDKSDYSDTGIGQTQCHGYVVALTDVHNSSSDRLPWENGPNGEYNQAVGTSTEYTTDWSGYNNCRKIHEFVEINAAANWEMKHFPAALACETYGNRTIDRDGNPTTVYAWQQPFIAPKNSSGWFLPSCAQLSYLWDNSDTFKPLVESLKETVSAGTLKSYICWFNRWYYWSSTENSESSARRVYFVGGDGGYRVNYKYHIDDVRAVLAF